MLFVAGIRLPAIVVGTWSVIVGRSVIIGARPIVVARRPVIIASWSVAVAAPVTVISRSKRLGGDRWGRFIVIRPRCCSRRRARGRLGLGHHCCGLLRFCVSGERIRVVAFVISHVALGCGRYFILGPRPWYIEKNRQRRSAREEVRYLFEAPQPRAADG